MENNKTEKSHNSIDDVLKWIYEDSEIAFQRLLPADEFGENDDACLIWQIVHDSGLLLKEQQERIKELTNDRSRFVAALDEIAHPIKHMQIRAEKEGNHLNGGMAVMIAKDPSYLQQIAERALKETTDQTVQ